MLQQGKKAISIPIPSELLCGCVVVVVVVVVAAAAAAAAAVVVVVVTAAANSILYLASQMHMSSR